MTQGNICIRLAQGLALLLLFAAVLPADQVFDVIEGWENTKWSDGSKDCIIPLNAPTWVPGSTEWHFTACEDINAVKIKSSSMGNEKAKPISGKACVCEFQNVNCVRIWGQMAYLGSAYSKTFTMVGYNSGGCGSQDVNGRLAGYIRLKAYPKNCVQLKGDVSEGGATHFWDNCATGENQQRRVMTYITSTAYQTFRVAADTSFCLALRDDNTNDGNPIVAKRCADASKLGRKWLVDGNLIKLKEDPSKCMRKAGSAPDFTSGLGIELGPCKGDAGDEWVIRWTQDH